MSATTNTQTQGWSLWIPPIVRLPIKYTLIIVLFLAATILVSLTIEWVGIAMKWWNTSHSKNMMLIELSYLNKDFNKTFANFNPIQWIITLQKYLFGAFDWLMGDGWNQSLRIPVTNQETTMSAGVRSFGGGFNSFILSVYHITSLVLLRLCILILLGIPVALFSTATLVDGLVERDLRREGAGRESSFIYHRIKKYKTWVYSSIFILYLNWPFTVHPNWIVLPMILVTGLMIYLFISSFKVFL